VQDTIFVRQCSRCPRQLRLDELELAKIRPGVEDRQGFLADAWNDLGDPNPALDDDVEKLRLITFVEENGVSLEGLFLDNRSEVREMHRVEVLEEVDRTEHLEIHDPLWYQIMGNATTVSYRVRVSPVALPYDVRWKMRIAISYCCVLGMVMVGGAVGCNDDGLGDSFQPREGDDDLPDGTLLPIKVGDTFWYQFSHSYRRTTGSCEGGLTCGEKQSSGNLCAKVSEVRDTETSAYRDAAETVVVANVKVVGGYSEPDIAFSDQDATTTADPTVVDAALAELWLKQLAVPTRGHNFLTPRAKEFHTRSAPTPPGQELAYLPFFDTRTSSDWDWGGWIYVNEDCALYLTEATCPAECKWEGACLSRTSNFLNDFLRYFITTYGVSFFTNTALFQKSHPVTSNCPANTTQQSCQANQCTWDFMANNGLGACITLLSLDLRWRHTLAEGPVELQGAVLHRLRLEYNEVGSLRSADEIIAPDPNPTAPAAVDLTNFTGCRDSLPCATGKFELDDRAWAEAYCTF
jgi:hypothetical protein